MKCLRSLGLGFEDLGFSGLGFRVKVQGLGDVVASGFYACWAFDLQD